MLNKEINRNINKKINDKPQQGEKSQTTHQAQKFLKQYFPSYIPNQDPYERIIIQTHPVIQANKKTESIIGVISYSIIYERAEINYIVVHENHRNKKIATNLLRQAVQKIKQANCINITLEVNENNIPAINFYLKYNFKKQAIRKNYYKNQNAYLMVRKLR